MHFFLATKCSLFILETCYKGQFSTAKACLIYSLSRNSPAFFLRLDCWLSKLKRISREATNLCFPLLFGRDITQQYFHIFSQYLPSLCFPSFPCQETFSVTPQPSERNIRKISKGFSWMLPNSDYFSFPFCTWGRDGIQILPIVHMCVPGILQLWAPSGSQPTVVSAGAWGSWNHCFKSLPATEVLLFGEPRR